MAVRHERRWFRLISNHEHCCLLVTRAEQAFGGPASAVSMSALFIVLVLLVACKLHFLCVLLKCVTTSCVSSRIYHVLFLCLCLLFLFNGSRCEGRAASARCRLEWHWFSVMSVSRTPKQGFSREFGSLSVVFFACLLMMFSTRVFQILSTCIISSLALCPSCFDRIVSCCSQPA